MIIYFSNLAVLCIVQYQLFEAKMVGATVQYTEPKLLNLASTLQDKGNKHPIFEDAIGFMSFAVKNNYCAVLRLVSQMNIG